MHDLVRQFICGFLSHMAVHPSARASTVFVDARRDLNPEWAVAYDAHALLTTAGLRWDGSCDADQCELVAGLLSPASVTVPAPPPPAPTVETSPRQLVLAALVRVVAELRNLEVLAGEEIGPTWEAHLAAIATVAEGRHRELSRATALVEGMAA